MKVCHICEKVVKILRSVSCLSCKKTYCFPCIVKYFPSHSKQLLPETQADALNKSKTKQCFSCRKICICDKCKSAQSILNLSKRDNQEHLQSGKVSNLIKEEQPIPENGFFKGKKISELPGFMQRAYLKKKVLYTKHELSMPSMMSIANAEEMAAERPDGSSKKQNKKGPQSGGEQLDESIGVNAPGDCSVSSKNHMENENQNQNEDNEAGEGDMGEGEDQNSQSAGQNENPASSQYRANANEEDEVENQSNQKNNAQQVQPEEGQSSSKKKEKNLQQKKERQKKLKQALENVQDQSSIELIHEED